MTYEVYRYIFIVAAILCGIMFVVSILLFVLLRVPKLISDLSGLTAKKAIKNIREQNEATGEKYHKVSAFNEARGKLTDKISPSGRIERQGHSMKFGIDTTKIATQELAPEAQSNETSVLGANETSVLGGNETSVLGMNETSILSTNEASVLEPVAGETSVLSEPTQESVDMFNTTVQLGEDEFKIEYEITYIHTNEIIEMEVAG